MKSFHKPLQPAWGMLQRSVASCQAAMQLVPFPNPVVARDPATIIMIRYDQTASGNDTRLVGMFFVFFPEVLSRLMRDASDSFLFSCI